MPDQAIQGGALDSAPPVAAAASKRGGTGGISHLILPYAFIVAFIALAALFVVAPTVVLAIQSVTGDHGFTLQYLVALGGENFVTAFRNSIVLSVVSALVAVVAGGLIAYFVQQPGTPATVRSAVTSFAAVAANFAGVPLAFAFISTLGTLGLLTQALKGIGIDIYGLGFSLFSMTGLTLVYSYFQIPLMVIIITPALLALRTEWREATENLGATSGQYWRLVGLPVLLPSLISSFILLFGSAFSAYATAYALTSGNIALLTTEIANVLSGDVSSSPQTGAALSVGMIVVMVGVLLVSSLFARRAARWHKPR
jgi:putative spermidine/putrescine transport system permease protein